MNDQFEHFSSAQYMHDKIKKILNDNPISTLLNSALKKTIIIQILPTGGAVNSTIYYLLSADSEQTQPLPWGLKVEPRQPRKSE